MNTVDSKRHAELREKSAQDGYNSFSAEEQKEYKRLNRIAKKERVDSMTKDTALQTVFESHKPNKAVINDFLSDARKHGGYRIFTAAWYEYNTPKSAESKSKSKSKSKSAESKSAESKSAESKSAKERLAEKQSKSAESKQSKSAELKERLNQMFESAMDAGRWEEAERLAEQIDNLA